MIVIFAIFLTTVLANSQEKYIDLLTDEEKQEFLDNVARRILDSVKSNGTSKGKRELTDEQLKIHESYVQSIMEQEAAAFKARRSKREDKSSKEDNKSKENDDLEVIPFQFRDDDVDKLDTPEADNIDLAVTGMNRRGYEEKPQDNLTDTSETDNVTEDTLPSQARSTTSDINSEETTEASTIKNSNEEEENVNYQGAATLSSEMHIHKSNLESTTKTEDIKIETSKTLVTSFENNSQHETSSVTSSFHEVDNDLIETSTSSKVQILEYDSAKKPNTIYQITERNDYSDYNFEPSSKATKAYTLDSSDSTQISPLPSESSTDSVINKATNKSSDVSTAVNRQVFTTTTQNTAEVNTATTENYSALTKDSLAKETVTETTTFSPILTTSNVKEEQSTKKPKKIKLIKTIKQPEIDTLVSYVASKALKNIKHELELKKKGKFIDNDIENNQGNTHLNHYQVYEIPWPIKRDNQPFLRSQEPTKHQPYFVPVHKYSPNFAYYNPKNRLGPNEVEENSIELDEAEPSEFVLQLNNEMRKFIHLLKWTTTTTTTTKAPGWDLLNPFQNRPKRRSTTTRAPFNPFKDIIGRRTTTRAPSADRENVVWNMPNPFNKKKRRSTTTRAPIYGNSESIEKEIGLNMLGIPNENNAFINLGKLQTFKFPLTRSKAESKVNIYMNVLKDLILEDSKSLKQYDWLTTTVQIQSALKKILKLIKRMRQSEQLYPADLQILRYMVFLHNFSLEVKKENNKQDDILRKRVKVFPKNTLLKEKTLPYLGNSQPDLVEDDVLSHLYEFLIDVQDGLFDLHEAIKHIAEVTKFERQNWYSNLKQLYLSSDEKYVRELLLHISMSRLVDLVENSCKHSLDDDFVKFVKTNKKKAKKIVEEMIFINDVVYDNTINTG